MKTLFILWIFIWKGVGSAEELTSPAVTAQLNRPEMRQAIKKIEDSFNEIYSEREKIFLTPDQSEYPVSAPCYHCPRYLSLSDQVRSALQGLKDQTPELNADDVLQFKIDRFQFMYWEASGKDVAGNVFCDRSFGRESDGAILENFSGRLNPILSKMIHFPDLSAGKFFDSKSHKVTYYYRGTGVDKDKIVEVKYNLASQKAVLRYYQVAPQVDIVKKEKDLDEAKDLSRAEQKLAVPERKESSVISVDTKLVNERGYDYRFLSGMHEAKIGDAVWSKTEGALSLRGTKSTTSITDQDNKQIALVNLEADHSKHRFDYKVVVPFEFPLSSEDEVERLHTHGAFETKKGARSAHFIVSKKQFDYVRLDYTYDEETHSNRLVIGEEYRLQAGTQINVKYGHQTPDSLVRTASAGLQQSIGKSDSLLFEVNNGNGGTAVISYEILLR